MELGQLLLNVGISALFAFAFSGRFARRAKKPNERWIWFLILWVAFIILSFLSFRLP
jgi:hypothetical protein